MTIRRSERSPWTVLSISGDLDIEGAPGLRSAVVREVALGSRCIMLDLQGVDFIDSFGIGVVVGALKRVRQRDGELAVVCGVPRIRRVFELCDLDRVLAIYSSITEALAAPEDAPLKRSRSTKLRSRRRSRL